MAYKLELPAAATIHPVFHISQLKKAFGECAKKEELVPYMTEHHKWLAIPDEVYGYQQKEKGVWEVLVSWKGLPSHEATWENYDDFHQSFPDYHLEDKVQLNWECNVRPPIIHQCRRRNTKEKENEKELVRNV